MQTLHPSHDLDPIRQSAATLKYTRTVPKSRFFPICEQAACPPPPVIAGLDPAISTKWGTAFTPGPQGGSAKRNPPFPAQRRVKVNPPYVLSRAGAVPP